MKKYLKPILECILFDNNEEILVLSGKGRNAADLMNEHFLKGDGESKTDLTTTISIQDVNIYDE